MGDEWSLYYINKWWTEAVILTTDILKFFSESELNKILQLSTSLHR